jgi:hypothetical protein
LSILLGDQTPSWCVLHELAHAMTSHADGRPDGHGLIFMGVYVRLIARYLPLDPQMLMDSLQDAGSRSPGTRSRCSSIPDSAGQKAQSDAHSRPGPAAVSACMQPSGPNTAGSIVSDSKNAFS